MVESGLATRTEVPTAVGILWISFYLDQSIIFDVANDATDGATKLAHGGDLFDPLVFVAVGPVPFSFGTWKIADPGHLTEGPQFVGLALDAVPFFHVDSLGQWWFTRRLVGRLIVATSVRTGSVWTTACTTGS